MEDFTPFSALVGGVLIGLAATLLLGANGRIAGISGIVGGSFSAAREDVAWRLVFIAGLLAGTLVTANVTGAAITMQASVPVLIVAGLLVGYGTRMGSGCTSGHGVCGIARLSVRSVVATATFMVVAGVTVFVVRHGSGG